AGDRFGRGGQCTAHARCARGRRRCGARGIYLPRSGHHPGSTQRPACQVWHRGTPIMMIPSIDIQNGQAVQLIGGEKKAIDAGDPRPIAAKFARVGEIALIDLDAAMGAGNNTAIMRDICAQYPCRVGGGIRDVQTAIDWLDAGARKVILGTAATPEILRELPRDRVIAA
ncbi:unnamed protein product, partial [Laminaria digitata]